MLCVKEFAPGGSHRDVDVGTNREISGCACASSKTDVMIVLFQ